MKILSRRIWISFVLLLLVLYVLVHVYGWINENSVLFVGADLEKKEFPNLDDKVSFPWDTLRVETEDGVEIILFESILSQTHETPWIIYFYGQAGQLVDTGNLARYKLFRNAGLNVFAVEYRGYGASENKEPTEEGVYADARGAWRYLREFRKVPPTRVVIYGYSLGGGVAIQLAKEMKPAGLITEGTFTSVPDMARINYPLMITVAMRNRFENLEKAKSLNLPWLLFHGQLDKKVPFEHAEALASTKAGARYLVSLECGHEDAFLLESYQMERAIKEFVDSIFNVKNDN